MLSCKQEVVLIRNEPDKGGCAGSGLLSHHHKASHHQLSLQTTARQRQFVARGADGEGKWAGFAGCTSRWRESHCQQHGLTSWQLQTRSMCVIETESTGLVTIVPRSTIQIASIRHSGEASTRVHTCPARHHAQPAVSSEAQQHLAQ